MKYHITKEGKKIKISDLETNHLVNIINWIEKMAKEGFTISHGGGTTAEDIWYDEETYYGKETKKILNYQAYKTELENRLNKTRYILIEFPYSQQYIEHPLFEQVSQIVTNESISDTGSSYLIPEWLIKEVNKQQGD